MRTEEGPCTRNNIVSASRVYSVYRSQYFGWKDGRRGRDWETYRRKPLEMVRVLVGPGVGDLLRPLEIADKRPAFSARARVSSCSVYYICVYTNVTVV